MGGQILGGGMLAEDPLLVDPDGADGVLGGLDGWADDVFALMRRFNADEGTAFLVVTHDPRLAARCDRIIELVDGMVAPARS